MRASLIPWSPIVTVTVDSEEVANIHLDRGWSVFGDERTDEFDSFLERIENITREVKQQLDGAAAGGTSVKDWGSEPAPKEGAALIRRVNKEAGWTSHFVNSLTPIVSINKDDVEVANVHLRDGQWTIFAINEPSPEVFEEAKVMAREISRRSGFGDPEPRGYVSTGRWGLACVEAGHSTGFIACFGTRAA